MESKTMDQWLNARPMSWLQWLVFVSTSLVMLTDGFDLQSLALAVPAIAREWSVTPDQLSYAFSFSMLGVGVGAAFFGPFGDRLGRKPTLIAALLTTTVGCCIASLSINPWQLTAGRFVTGVGIGAANVNAMALMADYVPLRCRFLLMTLMICMVALGSIIASLVAPEMIDFFGWQGFFAGGGILAIITAIGVALFLPESIPFLARQGLYDKVQPLAVRIDPAWEPNQVSLVTEKQHLRKASVRTLFSTDLIVKTLAIWSVYGLGVFTTYVLMSWLPLLLSRSGWGDSEALRGASSIHMGAILGGILVAFIMDKGYLVPALILGYLVSAVALLLLVVSPPTVLLWFVLLFFVGVGVSGMQLILAGISSALYPPELRATSSGWASAVARTGAVFGPVAGGIALAQGMTPQAVMGVLVIPIVVQVLILWFSRRWLVPS